MRGWNALNPEVAGVILKAVSEGNYLPAAAGLAGVKPDTVRTWIERGEGRHTRLNTSAETEAFAIAFREAEAACESTLVNYIYERAKKDPYLAMKYLARRFPQRWGNVKQPTTKEVDWEKKAEEMIQNGTMDRETFESEFGPALTEKLFAKVGKVKVGDDGSAGTQPDK